MFFALYILIICLSLTHIFLFIFVKYQISSNADADGDAGTTFVLEGNEDDAGTVVTGMTKGMTHGASLEIADDGSVAKAVDDIVDITVPKDDGVVPGEQASDAIEPSHSGTTANAGSGGSADSNVVDADVGLVQSVDESTVEAAAVSFAVGDTVEITDRLNGIEEGVAGNDESLIKARQNEKDDPNRELVMEESSHHGEAAAKVSVVGLPIGEGAMVRESKQSDSKGIGMEEVSEPTQKRLSVEDARKDKLERQKTATVDAGSDSDNGPLSPTPKGGNGKENETGILTESGNKDAGHIDAKTPRRFDKEEYGGVYRLLNQEDYQFAWMTGVMTDAEVSTFLEEIGKERFERRRLFSTPDGGSWFAWLNKEDKSQPFKNVPGGEDLNDQKPAAVPAPAPPENEKPVAVESKKRKRKQNTANVVPVSPPRQSVRLAARSGPVDVTSPSEGSAAGLVESMFAAEKKTPPGKKKRVSKR